MNHGLSPFKQPIVVNGLLKSPTKLREEKEQEDLSEKSIDIDGSNKSEKSGETPAPHNNQEDLVVDNNKYNKQITKQLTKSPELLKLDKMTSQEAWNKANKNEFRTIPVVYNEEIMDENKHRKTFEVIIEEDNRIHEKFLKLNEAEKSKWFGTDYEAHAPIVEKLKYLDLSNDDEDEYLNFFQNGSTSLIDKHLFNRDK